MWNEKEIPGKVTRVDTIEKICAFIILCLIIYFSGFLLGYWLSPVPVIVEKLELIEVIKEVEVIHEIEIIREVEVIKEIEKVIEIPVQLKPFESWHELSVWQANNWIQEKMNCLDAAIELQTRAIRDGYILNIEIWGDGLREGHAICSAVIGNEIYFLEPQSTFSWLAGKVSY